ncbi:class I SAM-dependent methyltransferase [Naasia lichenicola]|uniref:Class I SAM-dependent methyltransferase n=1 Tax=Naasia lichenicola TaxID=2565933 RepID=A0A4S4FLQ2_9MICO|nr:class I SAM-dependent methyltransferase [Naasia lichenicola]THG31121.1 class I SAM-dependent methyltransferase [Naasia lichenicola]
MTSGDWDSRYAAADAAPVWSVEPNAWVAETLEDLPPGRAVDLGAGEGRNALWLASRGWTVEAVDFSAVGLARGAQRAEGLGLSVVWTTADAAGWTPSGPLDLVLLSYLHLDEPILTTLLARAAGWLAPGGTLAVIGHHRDNIAHGVGGPQEPGILYTEDLLRAGAESLEIQTVGRKLREVGGADRPAIDAVLVARRAAPAADGPTV